MRLNFQQQRSINPSAGPNLFVPEGGQGIQNEQDLRVQLIRQQQESLNDVAQASVIVAKAFRDAEIQDENNDLETLANEIDKKADEEYFAFSQTNKGISTVNGELQSLEAQLNSIQESDSAKRSDRYQKKRKLIIQNSIGRIRKSYMQKASANTKDNSLQALLKKEQDLIFADGPLQTRVQELRTYAESLRPTLGIKVDEIKEKGAKRLFRQEIMRMLASQDNETRMSAYNLIQQQAENPSLGISPLYFSELSRQLRGEAFAINRDTGLSVMDEASKDVDPSKLQNFAQSLGSIESTYDKNGKQTSVFKIDEEKLKNKQKQFPTITKQEFVNIGQNTASQYDKIINGQPGTIDYSDVESDWRKSANSWLQYKTNEVSIDNYGNPQFFQSNSVDIPWELETFRKVKKDKVYMYEVNQLTALTNLIDHSNDVLEITSKNYETYGGEVGLKRMLEEAKKLHNNIDPNHPYWVFGIDYIENVERLLDHKISIFNDPNKKVLADAANNSSIGIPTKKSIEQTKKEYAAKKAKFYESQENITR